MDFKNIIKNNQNNVKNIIQLITKEDNEDLEQDVSIKVLQKRRITKKKVKYLAGLGELHKTHQKTT